jgi:hypothetical protein
MRRILLALICLVIAAPTADAGFFRKRRAARSGNCTTYSFAQSTYYSAQSTSSCANGQCPIK